MSPSLRGKLPGRWNRLDAKISTPLHCLESLLEPSAEWQLRAVVMVLPIIRRHGSYTILEESSLPHTTILTMIQEPSQMMSAYRCSASLSLVDIEMCLLGVRFLATYPSNCLFVDCAYLFSLVDLEIVILIS